MGKITKVKIGRSVVVKNHKGQERKSWFGWEAEVNEGETDTEVMRQLEVMADAREAAESRKGGTYAHRGSFADTNVRARVVATMAAEREFGEDRLEGAYAMAKSLFGDDYDWPKVRRDAIAEWVEKGSKTEYAPGEDKVMGVYDAMRRLGPEYVLEITTHGPPDARWTLSTLRHTTASHCVVLDSSAATGPGAKSETFWSRVRQMLADHRKKQNAVDVANAVGPGKNHTVGCRCPDCHNDGTY